MAIGYKTTNYDTFLTNLTHQKMSYAKSVSYTHLSASGRQTWLRRSFAASVSSSTGFSGSRASA